MRSARCAAPTLADPKSSNSHLSPPYFNLSPSRRQGLSKFRPATRIVYRRHKFTIDQRSSLDCSLSALIPSFVRPSRSPIEPLYSRQSVTIADPSHTRPVPMRLGSLQSRRSSSSPRPALGSLPSPSPLSMSNALLEPLFARLRSSGCSEDVIEGIRRDPTHRAFFQTLGDDYRDCMLSGSSGTDETA